MAPTTVGCPNRHGHARGHLGQGHLGLHARQEPRGICHAWHNTFRARNGTGFSRRRPSAETVGIVVTLRAPGCPLHALVAAVGVDERTGADGWARAGRQGPAIQASVVAHPRAVGQGHADARRGTQPGGLGWMALAMMGKTRVWRGGAGSAQRDLPLIRRLSARGRRWAARRPLVRCPDGWGSYLRARRETCRAPGHTGTGGRPRRRPGRHLWLAPVITRDARRRVVATDRRLVEGTPARGETRRRRAHGDGVRHTADLERRTATFRERRAPLARRCRALARHPLTRHAGRVWVGTVSHLCPPPARVSHAPKTTPALAAGSPDHGWTVRARLSCRVPLSRWAPPKRRGRPSQALQWLMERWCS